MIAADIARLLTKLGPTPPPAQGSATLGEHEMTGKEFEIKETHRRLKREILKPWGGAMFYIYCNPLAGAKVGAHYDPERFKTRAEAEAFLSGFESEYWIYEIEEHATAPDHWKGYMDTSWIKT